MSKFHTQMEVGKNKGHGKTQHTFVCAAFLRANLQPDIPLQHLLWIPARNLSPTFPIFYCIVPTSRSGQPLKLSGSKQWVSETHMKSVSAPNQTGGRRSMEKGIQKTLHCKIFNPIHLCMFKRNQLAETINILFKSHGQDLAK